MVFECVGAAGLSSGSSSAELGTRLYCAGGWYTGDTLDITAATRKGVTLPFGGVPMPQDWYGVLDAVAAAVGPDAERGHDSASTTCPTRSSRHAEPRDRPGL